MPETEQAEEQTQQQSAEGSDQTEAKNAEFEEVSEGAGVGGEASLDVLLEIAMPITVNIGTVKVPFKRLLQLGPGSVLQLDKPIGQPAELYVQDIKFATGDIVVVDNCFAVRIKEVMGVDLPQEPAPE